MDYVEDRAKEVFEKVTRRQLTRWDKPPRQGAVDFRCVDVPTVSLEVKRVTNKEFHLTQARVYRDGGFRPSSRLTMRWSIGADAPTSGDRAQAPDVKRWAEEGEDILLGLEQAGITCTRGAPLQVDPKRGWYGPMREFWEVFGDAIATATHPTPRMPPGFEVVTAWGHMCSDDPNALAAVVDEFLGGDTGGARNLRDKLGRSDDDSRDAFLVVTSAVDEAWLLDDWGHERPPSNPLALPEMIDRVWVIGGGPTVWWFDSAGWHGAKVEADAKTYR
jgi:hypothetical protein